MSKRNHICFDCLVAVRREAPDESLVFCPSCGEKCTNIGYTIPVPPKSKPKEWEKLKSQLFHQEMKAQRKTAISNVKYIHELEIEITNLEALPENKGRIALIKKLNKQLKAIDV